MNTFTSIAALAAFSGIAVSAAQQLVPSERFLRQLRLIFCSVFVLCLIKPFASGKYDFGEMLSFSGTPAGISSADGVIDRAVAEQTELLLEENICRVMGERGIDLKEISVSVNINGDGSISISEVAIGCDSPNTAKKILREMLGEEIIIRETEYE